MAWLAGTVFRDVYYGIPPSIPVSAIAATCKPATEPAACDVNIVRLNPGRFYLSTTAPASSLTLVIGDAAAIEQAHVFLVRPETGARLSVGVQDGGTVAEAFGRDVPATGRRTVVAIPSQAPAWNRLTFTPVESSRPFIVSEFGLFADDHDLLRSTRQPLPSIPGPTFYSSGVVALTLVVCAFVVAAAWLEPDVMGASLPWLLAVLCLGVCLIEIGTVFSPYWSHDPRSMFGEELVRSGSGGNLTGGIYEGPRLVQGLGDTIDQGIVQWHRMPGTGCSPRSAAFLGRTTDVVEIAMLVIVLQVLVYGVAVGVFVGVARRTFGVPMASLLGVLITLMPKQLNYTEVDSIIAPISLLLLSALLLHLAAERDGTPAPFRTFVVVNLAFALWFVMRNDVLFGWIVVSFALCGRRWRRLAVPILLIAAIAVPWGLYKRQYRHEFNLLPTNAGEVLLLGLCEAPGAFPYECNDGGYFDWARRVGHPDAASQPASNLAVAETVRHWVTYPVHFGFMVWFKLRRAVFGESWPGFRSRLNVLYAGLMREVGLFVALLTVWTISLAVNHQRRRSLVLGWALFLNMPMFFLVFSSNGRFYAAAGVSLLVAAVPLLFERGLYLQIRRHGYRAAVVGVCVGLFIAEGRRVEDWVRTHDSVHYWAPILDPERSTLKFVVR